MTDKSHLLDDYAPEDPIMYVMWAGCLRWALGEKKIMDAFRAETGNNWSPGRTGIEQMVDEATGVMDDFFVQFVKWFNENVWGVGEDGKPEDAPK